VFLRSQAAVVLNQVELTPGKLVAEVKRILNDSALREKLSSNTVKVMKRGAVETLAGIIKEMIG